MILIPSGEIVLRDDRKKQSWSVNIPSFLLGKYPVTQVLYYDVTGKAPSAHAGDHNPVETVSWFDAIHFCNLLSQKSGSIEYYIIENEGNDVKRRPDSDGYRLPDEAEWQYACKAGNNKPRYGDLDEISWYKVNSEGSPRKVGQKAPNDWGLYDMLGNVWEWCWDLYDEEVYGSYRVFRGGGWNDPERGCLATNRRRGHPAFKIDDLGFRLARSAPIK